MNAAGEAVRDAVAGLAARPGRTVCAFTAIAVGAAGLSLLLGVLSGLRGRIDRLAGELGLSGVALLSPEAGGGTDVEALPLTHRQVDRLRSNVPQAQVSGIRFGEVRGPEGASVRVVYTDDHLACARGWPVARGRFLDRMDLHGRERSAVATEALAVAEGWGVGDMLRMDGVGYRLVGTVRTDESALGASDAGGRLAAGDRTLFLPDAARPGGRERIDVVYVRGGDGAEPERVRLQVERLVGQPDFGAGPVQWITADLLTARWRRFERMARAAGAAATAVYLLLAGAMLSTLWLMSVRERIPEIGLRRALGAGRRAVGALFLIEALLLSLGAGLFGTALVQAAAGMLSEGAVVPYEPGGIGAWFPPVGAVAVGTLMAWAPARRAARIEPAEALRTD